MSDEIKKILVPLDGSENSMRGLNKAISIAKLSGGEIKGVYIRPSAPVFGRNIKPKYSEILTKDEEFLNTAKNIASENKINLSYHITEVEKPGEFIVKFAQDQNCDLIVIGARGIGTVKEFFFGSVSNYVVHKTQIPILIIK
jgi:nucleotide-binding universal stress UspA family protein